MSDLFSGGSPVFMGLLSIIGGAMLIYSGLCIKTVMTSTDPGRIAARVKFIREIGLFALIMGVLSTTIDLLGAFSAIEQAGEVPMSMLAGGLKYALVTVIYGLMIYALSWFIWFAFQLKVSKAKTT